MSEPFRLRLPISIVEAGQIPFYAAEAIGAYDRAGLSVSLEIGDPAVNSVEKVADGTFDAGVLGGPDTLLVHRARGVDVQAFGLMHEKADFTCLMTRPAKDIRSVADLHGTRVGTFPGHISTEILRAWFAAAGVAVEEEPVGLDFGPFLAGEIEAMWAFRTTAVMALEAEGVDLRVFNPADAGIHSHGYTLFAGGGRLAAAPDVYRRFLAATAEGMAFARTRPEEAVRFLLEVDPYADLALNARRLAAYNAVSRPDPGPFSPDLFRPARDRLRETGQLAGPLDPAEAIREVGP